MLSTKLKLPRFWCEVFTTLNQCKTIKNIEILNDSELLAQPIWFKATSTPLFSNIVIYLKLIKNTCCS